MRGLFVGTVMSVFVGLAAPYGMIMVKAAEWGAHASQLGGVFLFFVFTLFINVMLGLIRRPLSLNRAELVCVYVMMLVGSVVVTTGFTGSFLSVITGAMYYATPENNWADLFVGFQHPWLVPTDWDAVRYFYEGLPQGMAIPWTAWAIRSASWMNFMLAL